MKKIISALLVVAMLCAGVAAAVPAFAADLPVTDKPYTFMTADVTSKKVTVSIYMGNVSKIMSYRIAVGYNSEALKLSACNNSGEVFSGNEYFAGNINANPYIYFAAASDDSLNNISVDGNKLVATLEFDVLSQKNFDFTLGVLDSGDIYYAEGTGSNTRPVTIDMDFIIDDAIPAHAPANDDIDYSDLTVEQLVAKMRELPSYDKLTDDDINKMLAIADALNKLSEEDLKRMYDEYESDLIAYKRTFSAYMASQAGVDVAKIDAIIKELGSIPAAENMTEADAAKLKKLLNTTLALDEMERVYLFMNDFDTYFSSVDKLTVYLEANGVDVDAVDKFVEIMLQLNLEYANLSEADIANLLKASELYKSFNEDQILLVKINGGIGIIDKYKALMAAYEAAHPANGGENNGGNTSAPDTTAPAEGGKTVPPTGDGMIVVIAAAAVAALGCAGVVAVRRKKIGE